MKIPKPQNSVFEFEMLLLFRGLDSRILNKVSTKTFRELDIDERSSLIASN